MIKKKERRKIQKGHSNVLKLISNRFNFISDAFNKALDIYFFALKFGKNHFQFLMSLIDFLCVLCNSRN